MKKTVCQHDPNLDIDIQVAGRSVHGAAGLAELVIGMLEQAGVAVDVASKNAWLSKKTSISPELFKNARIRFEFVERQPVEWSEFYDIELALLPYKDKIDWIAELSSGELQTLIDYGCLHHSQLHLPYTIQPIARNYGSINAVSVTVVSVNESYGLVWMHQSDVSSHGLVYQWMDFHFAGVEHNLCYENLDAYLKKLVG